MCQYVFFFFAFKQGYVQQKFTFCLDKVSFMINIWILLPYTEIQTANQYPMFYLN